MTNIHLAIAENKPALGIAIAIFIGILNAINSQILRKQGDNSGKRVAFQIVAVWTRLLFACMFLIFLDFQYGSLLFIVITMICGFFYIGNNLCAYYSIMMGPIAIAWTMAWLSAPLVGFMWTIYPANEPWSVNQIIGIAMFLVCLPTMGFSTYRHNRIRGEARPVQKYFFIITIGSFLFGAIAGYFNKFTNDYESVISGSPLAFLLVSSFVTATGFSAFHRIRRSRGIYGRIPITYGLISGLLTAFQFLLMAYGIRMVEIARFFPTMASTAIILSTIFAAILHKEPPSTITIIGIVTSICAIIFFVIG